jgi:hypothetical protein
VTQQNDKSWQYGQTAATLLVAYLLVLQGLAAGLAVGARAGQSAFGGAVCVTSRTAGAEQRSQGPRAPAHSMDACCVQHCIGLDGGVAGGFVGLDPPRSPLASVLTPLRESLHVERLARLPVGARAPPAIAV